MSQANPPWLPTLLLMADHDHAWKAYIDAVYAVFERDMVISQPKFDGCWVRCRRDPLYDSKIAGFWHCVQEGPDEEQRTPDLRRCERVGWIRAVIDHATDPQVDVWSNRRGTDQRWLLWYREQYLVVLAERKRARDGFRTFQLITAYCTPEENRKRRLRSERDAYQERLTPPP